MSSSKRPTGKPAPGRARKASSGPPASARLTIKPGTPTSRPRTIELPPQQDMREHIRFVVAAITPCAEPFVRWLLGPIARSHLLESGFLPARLA